MKKLIIFLALILLPVCGWCADISTLSDNFDDNTIDTDKWNLTEQNYATATETGQQLEIATDLDNIDGALDYASLSTDSFYTLSDSGIAVELIQYGGEDSPSIKIKNAYPYNYVVYIQVQNNRVYTNIKDNGTDYYGSSFVYNSNVHKWFRIAEYEGSIYLDYSSDGLSWVTFYSHTCGVPASGWKVYLQSFGLNGVASTSIFDNLLGMSYPPPVPPTTSSISDNFNDNEINTVLWISGYEEYGTVTEQNSQLEFTADGLGLGGAQVFSDFLYTFDSVIAELVSPPIVGGIAHFGFSTSLGFGADIAIYYDAELEKLRCQFTCYDSDDNQYTEIIDYDSNYKYFKITENTGVLYYYTSPNGITWTQRWSYDHSIDFENLLVGIYIGLYSDSIEDTATWDNFNILPKVPYVFNNAILNNVTIE
jgi:hypothetical protein